VADFKRTHRATEADALSRYVKVGPKRVLIVSGRQYQKRVTPEIGIGTVRVEGELGKAGIEKAAS
jgi:hypothetical protein